MLTKIQARTTIQHMIDDPAGVRWPVANLDVLISMTLDSLYAEILEASPYAVSQLDTVTPTSPGYVDLRTTADSGDLSQRLARIQSVTRDGQEYGQLDRRNVVLEGGAEITYDEDYGFVLMGKELHLIPYSVTEDVELRYSYTPTAFWSLDDGDDVEWPDGHELVYTSYLAALAMARGGAEDGSAWMMVHAVAKQSMMGAISRRAAGPQTLFTSDTSIGWGSIT
jgi:hypothetical protein